MKRNNSWKWALVIFLVAWSLWSLNPPASRDLIEEFQNEATKQDATFNSIVKRAKELKKENSANSFGNLKEAIGTNDIRPYFPDINTKAELDPTRAILNRVQKDAAGKIKLGLDLQGGTSFLVGMDTNKLDSADKDRVLSQAVEVLRKRIDKFGIAEPVIQPAGNDRISIQLPGLSQDQKDEYKRKIETAAFLEFRLVHEKSADLIQQGITEPGYEILQMKSRNRDGTQALEPFLVQKKLAKGLTGNNIKRAMVIRDQISNQPQIDFELDAKGAELFGQVTSENIGRQLAIVLDGELYSAPTIQGAIMGGRGQITGQFDLKEARELADVLENPLEAPVTIIEERGVDPSLGKDSVESGVKAAIYGTIAIAVFMLIYYMWAGLVANAALILNIIILLGVMCAVGTTLTLPGIAGIVLTIGMAVDANVLIFERIREELAAGKSLRGAVSAGYDKAFSTIFDSNLTTLISSVILIYMGTGSVKGFGVTLTIGITVSMFTALVVTRLIFDWLLEKNILKSLPMLHLVPADKKIDFLRWAKPAFAASWLLIIIGIGYGIHREVDFQKSQAGGIEQRKEQAKGIFGVDFRGGDVLTMRFAQRVPADQLRDAVGKLGVGDATIQYQKDPATGTETLRIATAFDTGGKVEEGLKSSFSNAKFERIALDKVGPTVGKEIQTTAVYAVMLSLFGILIYVAFRYEFSFAVGAVIAIIHDVLMTMGWFFLTGRELSAPMVAAVLTIIGFSINDTIVIFDRIREDLKLGVRGSLREVMNQALNQTLSRTVITSGTVFLATMSLYLFGGGVINDFAFTFLVGIITGTYSSIYIASTIVLWWHKGERPKLASQVTVENTATVKV
ncbi:MAG: protein translocase subunit SecD [Verrucomicrobiota bacterium]